VTSRAKECERSVAYTGKKFTVERSVLEHPNGRTSVVEVVRHPGAVVILPVTESGEILAIRQYRHALSTSILELPAGTLEVGESPHACASREIMEEVGYRAGTMLDLGILYPAPGFCDEKQYLFLATDLSPASAPADDDEVIEVVPMSIEGIREAIKSGELSDAKSIAAFSRAELRGLLPLRRS
jgi:ADP-ribose pyrophosphatase